MKKLKKLGKWHYFAALATLVLVLEIGCLVFEVAYKDRFYPGVVIGGEAVGGKTYQEVVDHFKIQVDVLAKEGLEVNLSAGKGEKKVTIPMTRIGLTSDTFVDYFSIGNWRDVIAMAYGWGRSGSFAQKFAERFSLIPTKRFTFPVTVYGEAVSSLIEQELSGWLVKVDPAKFSVAGAEVVIVDEQIGERIDLAAVAEAVNAKLIALDVEPIYFVAVAEVPLVTAQKLEPFLPLVNELARSTTLVFRYNGYKWKVIGQVLASWLTLKSDGEIGVDQEKLAAFLNKTAVSVIDNPPQNSRFEIHDGNLVETVPGSAGQIVDVQKTIESVEQIISGAQKSLGIVDVPVVIIDAEPRVTKETIEQYGIKDLVGVARTSFKGSSGDRRNNIQLGAAKLNGLLIAPGEEFSVVNGIGEVTEEGGYAKEFVIKDGQSIKELGGGLCQIATTMFRAVLNAGLPVTERQNHRYVVGYYGPGLDATIYGPHPDLRFVNDTGNYLLLQGRIEGDYVAFEFYGQKDGRVATVSEPEITDKIAPPVIKLVPTYDLEPYETKCTEHARYGLTADALYSIAYKNGRIREQNFHSVYVPWQEVCLVGVAR